MASNFYDESIRDINTENITNRLVPDKFKYLEDGMFYNTIKSFVEVLYDDMVVVNNNFRSMVDIDSLDDVDIIKVYHQTYLSTLNLDKLDNTSALISSSKLFKVIKDVTAYKGSAFLIILLSNLLVMLVPSVRSTIKAIEDKLDNPNISPTERNYYTNQLKVVADSYTKESLISVTEDPTIPFVYTVNGEIDFISWHKYIKPFAHPIGWSVNFFNNVQNLMMDRVIDMREWVIINEMFHPSEHPYISSGRYRSATLDYTYEELLEMIPPERIGTTPSGTYYYKYIDDWMVFNLDELVATEVDDFSVYITPPPNIGETMVVLEQDHLLGYDVDMIFPTPQIKLLITVQHHTSPNNNTTADSKVGSNSRANRGLIAGDKEFKSYKQVTFKEMI